MDSGRSPAPFIMLLAATALIGPVGVAAPRGLVPLLGIACFAGAVMLWPERRFTRAFPLRLTIPLAAFAAIGVASAGWAPDPLRAATLTLKVAVLCVAGLVVLRAAADLDDSRRARLEDAFLAGYGLGFVVLGVAVGYVLASGESLWGRHEGDPFTPLSRGEAVLALLSAPAATVLWRRRGWWAGAVLVAAVITAFAFLSNMTVLGAMGGAAAAFLMVRVWGRRGLLVLAVVVAGVTIAAPAAMRLVPSGDDMFHKVGTVYPSAVHRIYVWHFVTDRVFEHPWRGWGMDASRRIPGGDQNLNLDPLAFWDRELLPLHPHNSALQAWLELGVPGGLLMAVVIWIVLVPPAGAAPPLADPLRAAATTGYLVIGGLSYGLWQNWWVAMAWLLAALAVGCVGPDVPAKERRTT